MLKKLFGGSKKKEDEGKSGNGGASRGYPGADYKRQQGGGANPGYPGAAYVPQPPQSSQPPRPPQQQPPPYYTPAPGSAVPYNGQSAPPSYAQAQQQPQAPPPPYASSTGGGMPPPYAPPPQGANYYPPPQQQGANYYTPVQVTAVQQQQPPPPVNYYAPVQVAPPQGGNGYPMMQQPRPNGYPMQQPQQPPPYYAPGPQAPPSSLPSPSAPPLPDGMEYYRPDNPQSIQMHSNCQGRRRALFIGICYYGTQAELRGCVNDVKNLFAFLQKTYGLRTEDTRILTDDPSFSQGQPTRQAILASLQWLVQGAGPGDSLFLHYSGHGGRVRDQNGDEEDGYDETILPLDHQRAGEIIDDDLHNILVKPLPRGVRLTSIFDSCHSGSVMDLPYSYKVDGSLEIVQIDNTKRMMDSLMSAGAAYLRGNKTAALMHAMQGLGSLMGPGENKEAKARAEREKSSDADVIQFSGCRDDQTSADAHINGQATGAMSWAFIEALKRDGPNQPFTSLLKNMRRYLTGKYSQVPQISTSHKMDLRAPFMI